MALKVPLRVGPPFSFQNVHDIEGAAQVALCNAQVEQHLGGNVFFWLVFEEPTQGRIRLAHVSELDADFCDFTVIPRVVFIKNHSLFSGGQCGTPLIRSTFQAGQFKVNDRGFGVGVQTGKEGFFGPLLVPFDFGDLRAVVCAVKRAVDTSIASVGLAGAAHHRTTRRDEHQDQTAQQRERREVLLH